MSSEDKAEQVDRILDVLSKPLNRYILSVLAGVDPGPFTETIEIQDDIRIDEKENTQ
ncbi:MAG: hypothetical protein JW779_02275 [Candidatus Thorarchaeota archaeon]|nr:hypothetical protein [Candidatus Thorarchaeota archaeon]